MPCAICGLNTCKCREFVVFTSSSGVETIHSKIPSCDDSCKPYTGKFHISGKDGTEHTPWSQCRKPGAQCVPVGFKWGTNYSTCTCEWNDYGHRFFPAKECPMHGEKKKAPVKPKADAVNHPAHYTSHPSGVEAITVTEHFNFNVGNAIKYLWRAGLKDSAKTVEDLRKAAFYVQREIDRLEREK